VDNNDEGGVDDTGATVRTLLDEGAGAAIVRELLDVGVGMNDCCDVDEADA
jgi:hypothetical protein